MNMNYCKVLSVHQYHFISAYMKGDANYPHVIADSAKVLTIN